jgi:hypothetical protein
MIGSCAGTAPLRTRLTCRARSRLASSRFGPKPISPRILGDQVRDTALALCRSDGSVRDQNSMIRPVNLLVKQRHALHEPHGVEPWRGLRIVLVASFRELAASCIEFAEHFHQVADLDILERTHSILDLLARSLGGVTSRELVELRLDLAPGKGSVRAAWVG